MFKNGAEMGANIYENPYQNDVGFLIRKRVCRHPHRPRPGTAGEAAPPTTRITVYQYQTVTSQTNEMIVIVNRLNKTDE